MRKMIFAMLKNIVNLHIKTLISIVLLFLTVDRAFAVSCENAKGIPVYAEPEIVTASSTSPNTTVITVIDRMPQISHDNRIQARGGWTDSIKECKLSFHLDKGDLNNPNDDAYVGTCTLELESTEELGNEQKYTLELTTGDNGTAYCVSENTVTLIRGSAKIQDCNISFEQDGYDNPSCIDANKPVTVHVDNVIYDHELANTDDAEINFRNMTVTGSRQITITNGSGSVTIQGVHDGTGLFSNEGKTEIFLEAGWLDFNLCSTPPNSITVKTYCTPEEKALQASTDTLISFDLCKFAGDNRGKCTDCEAKNGVWTALGCIRFSPTEFVKDFMSIALGIAGGLALLLMIYGAFLIASSAGDPKKAEQGKEIITGTIAGLLFIVFSVVLLKFIGVDLFQLPGISEL